MIHQRPTRAVIDLDNLAFNFHSVKWFVGPDVEYMSVVKADAYGHGAVRCARRLENEGTDLFAVATVEEGAELRSAGIERPIIILGGFWPGQETVVIELDLTPVIFRLDQAESLNTIATARKRPTKIHVKIDTGMGRIGFRDDDISAVADGLARLGHLEIEGLMTHFAVADRLEETDFTNQQISRFSRAVEAFQARGIHPRYTDLANSPGAIAHPEARSNMVRLGGVLYGLGDDILPAGIEKPELLPVMAVRSEVALIKQIRRGETVGYGRTYTAERDSLVATIPIGYHDGYPRALSNKGKMIIKGEFATVVGRISMDWTTVEVTDIPGVKAGDPVTIIGSENEASIKAEDIAAILETISYEVTCRFAGRVTRIFKE